jgi:O-methyltransferase
MSAAALRRDMQPAWDEMARDPAALRAAYPEFEEAFWPLYDRVQDQTMTSIERLYDLYKAIDYVSRSGISGAIVECGVWRGGSMMLAALTLKAAEDFRDLYLFDTFSGQPPPGEQDIDLHGDHALKQWHLGWNYSTRSAVWENMRSTGYPAAHMHLVPGPVEKTLLPICLPEAIALARLDTDFYESTQAGIAAVWPRLQKGGVLIIDDYGHWRGCQAAIDEYFAERPQRMVRVDYSCRVIQK